MAKSQLPNIYKYLLIVLFLQFLFLPKMWMWAKIGCLALMLIYTIIHKRGLYRFNKDASIIMIFVLWNILSLLHGILKGYGDFAIRRGTVDILWPLCFFLLSGFSLGAYELRWLKKALIIVTFILSCIDLGIFLTALIGNRALIEFFNIFNLNPIRVEIAGITHFNLRIDHQYLFAFLTPFCLISCIERIDKNRVYSSRHDNKIGFTLLTAILAVLVSILIGVAGIWLALASGIILYIVFYHPKKINKNFIVSAALIGFLLVILIFLNDSLRNQIGYVFSEIANRLFSSSGDSSDITRSNQATAMINQWIDSPIIGQGTGATVSYYRDSVLVDTAENELTYIVMLYQKGIIGLFLFAAIVWRLAKKLRSLNGVSDFAIPFFIGMISFLIPNAFNPYLANISTMWIVYLPFLIRSTIEEERIVENSHMDSNVYSKNFCQ